MSQAQLDEVIREVQACFGSFGPTTPLQEMRSRWDGIFANVKPTVGARTETVTIGKAKADFITAPGADGDRAILYLHGGGYVLGSIDSHRDMCERLSRAAKARVLALDYRLAPENPFPAAVEDAQAAYRWLLEKGFAPSKLAISGDSAGGGLTLTTLLALKRDGDPMPGCATPISPWVDLEGTGESVTKRAASDPMVQKEMLLQLASTYVPNGNVRDPLAAPLYGDLAGLPPLLIHVGEREVIYDDAKRIYDKAKAAGVDATLEEGPGMIHVWHIFANKLDEGEEAIRRLGAFIVRHTA